MNLPNLIVAPELLYECKSRDLEFAAPKIWVQAFIPNTALLTRKHFNFNRPPIFHPRVFIRIFGIYENIPIDVGISDY